MYEKDGEKYFVVDEHIHFWDARPENWKNVHGQQFIECFHDYQTALSPDEYKWPIEEFYAYSEERILHDLFEVGYVDKAIFQPTYLTDFYKDRLQHHGAGRPTRREVPGQVHRQRLVRSPGRRERGMPPLEEAR